MTARRCPPARRGAWMPCARMPRARMPRARMPRACMDGACGEGSPGVFRVSATEHGGATPRGKHKSAAYGDGPCDAMPCAVCSVVRPRPRQSKAHSLQSAQGRGRQGQTKPSMHPSRAWCVASRPTCQPRGQPEGAGEPWRDATCRRQPCPASSLADMLCMYVCEPPSLGELRVAGRMPVWPRPWGGLSATSSPISAHS